MHIYRAKGALQQENNPAGRPAPRFRRKKSASGDALFQQRGKLACLVKHHVADVANRLSRVQAFRTNRHTVHDAFAAEQRERVI